MGLLRNSLLAGLSCAVMSVQAANWNSGKAKPVKVETSMPILGLTGVGINSMALWSGASQVRTADQMVSHLSPLGTHGFSHVVLVSCADWIIDLRCKKGISKAVSYTHLTLPTIYSV